MAYESAAQKWGKDFGVYDRKGICLYLGHTLRVSAIEGGRAMETAGPLDDALRFVPGLTGREMGEAQGNANPGMKNATVLGPRNSIPRIAADSQGRIFLTFRSGSGHAVADRHHLASVPDVVRRLALGAAGRGAGHRRADSMCGRRWRLSRRGTC